MLNRIQPHVDVTDVSPFAKAWTDAQTTVLRDIVDKKTRTVVYQVAAGGGSNVMSVAMDKNGRLISLNTPHVKQMGGPAFVAQTFEFLFNVCDAAPENVRRYAEELKSGKGFEEIEPPCDLKVPSKVKAAGS